MFLKDLRVVWSKFGDTYGRHNTLLIDDSPIKTFANPEGSAVFLDSYRSNGSRQNEIFLNSVLWPFLLRLQSCADVEGYTLVNTPK